MMIWFYLLWMIGAVIQRLAPKRVDDSFGACSNAGATLIIFMAELVIFVHVVAGI